MIDTTILEMDSSVQALLHAMVNGGISNAAAGLSQMIGENIEVNLPSISLAPIRSVPERVGGPEALMVGIYLACEGEVGGHIMLIMGLPAALELADLLLEQPDGQTNELDVLARSALAEVGNLTGSFFLNAIAGSTGLSCRPSPPAVIVDMAGAILDIVLVSAGQLGDEILLLEAVFRGSGRKLQLQFWIAPDLTALQSFRVQHAS